MPATDLTIRSLLALLLLLSAAVQAAGDFSNRNAVRNGDFALASTSPGGYPSGWHTSFDKARVVEGVGQGGGNVLNLEGDDQEPNFAWQQLHLPDRIDAATLRIRLRVALRFEALAPLPGELITLLFALAPVDADGQVDIDGSVFSGPLFAPLGLPSDWLEGDVPLEQGVLDALTQAAAASGDVALFFRTVSNGSRLAVLLDEVALRFDGRDEPTGQAGQIAFVDGGRLRRVSPDGGPVQTVWTHPGDSPDLRQPRWRPDGQEIAFISDHELAFSPAISDVYGITPAGSGLRRISHAPSQGFVEAALLAGSLPQGSVRLTITNNYQHFSGDTVNSVLVLVRGGRLEPFTMPPPGQSAVITLQGIGRFQDAPQDILIFYSSNRCGLGRRDFAGQVAIVPGVEVQHSVGFNAVTCTGLRPTALELAWKRDGSQLGYTLSNAPFLLPVQGSTGSGAVWFSTASQVGSLAWSPSDDRLLHELGTLGLWQRDLATAAAPTQLIAPENSQFPEQADWLPDASGFLYTQGGNLHSADAAGGNRQRLTLVGRDERLSRASASPDGRWLAIEREIGGRAGIWILQRERPGRMRFLAEGRMPHWGPAAAPPSSPRIFEDGFE